MKSSHPPYKKFNYIMFSFLGKKSEDADNVDWVPSKFEFNKKQAIKQAAKRHLREGRHAMIQAKRDKGKKSDSQEMEAESTATDTTDEVVHEIQEVTESNSDELSKVASLEAELLARNTELHKLREENAQLRMKNRNFCFSEIKGADDLVRFYTGLPSASVFIWVTNLVMGKVASCHSSLTSCDHVLIIFMRLRLGLLYKDLGQRFGVPESTMSKVYRTWLPIISSHLRQLIIWPDRATLRQNLPQSFRRKFRDCVCIIDCSEIFIERPTNLTARAQTWSNYKHNNTCKYLIGISPAGAVMFLSEGWGGRVSDKQITSESGFLDKITHGDCVLADRGFLIQDELTERGAILKIPKFTKGKKQLPGRDVDESRQLAHVRIHVERVIGRLKDYRILQTIVPISQVDLIDDMMTVICGAINLNKSVVGSS